MKIIVETKVGGTELDETFKAWAKVCNFRLLADWNKVEIQEPQSYKHRYRMKFTLEYERIRDSKDLG